MSEAACIRILSVDDHPLMREGIAAVINDQPDMKVVAEAATGRDAIQQFRVCRPDVTLLDLRLPDMSGIVTLATIRKEFSNARVIVLTTFDGDVEIQRALSAGAHGYILKSMPTADLFSTIRQVHAGKKHISPAAAQQLADHFQCESLTQREMDVLTQLAEGDRNRDIAAKLFVSEDTVKVHVKNIMEKLDAADRTQAVAIAVRRGFIHL